MIGSPMKMKNELAWGRNETFRPPWTQDQIRNLVRRDAHMLDSRVPFTQALILSARVPGYATDIGAASFALRWDLQVGTGGGLIRYRIDAGGTQRLSLPAEQCGVALVCEAMPGIAYASPDQPIDAGAFMADGTAEGGGATYTTRFSVGAGATALLTPPIGAVAFRVLAIPGGANDAFTASTLYQTLGHEEVVEEYAGDFIAPIRYMPFPFSPQADLLRVNNTANGDTATAYLEWSIDL